MNTAHVLVSDEHFIVSLIIRRHISDYPDYLIIPLIIFNRIPLG